eukprot:m.180544 g.180544  ORF g.180544 m.180544 type:complete len:89 (-) comp14950_c0_seq6:2530-2796(-)
MNTIASAVAARGSFEAAYASASAAAPARVQPTSLTNSALNGKDPEKSCNSTSLSRHRSGIFESELLKDVSVETSSIETFFSVWSLAVA